MGLGRPGSQIGAVFGLSWASDGPEAQSSKMQASVSQSERKQAKAGESDASVNTMNESSKCLGLCTMRTKHLHFPRSPGPTASATSGGEGSSVRGLAELLHAAAIPECTAECLYCDVVELGAAAVGEVMPADWETLRSWPALRPLEQRRLLQIAARAEFKFV